ncbi:DUF4012 domain-containing protein [Bifidobacterium animalis]|uniref:DUF4012 domain-containing protein n=1 Tax=Bifidobacterium animalis TaxID=28025 RepID=UPI001C3EC817|nr:DUF4012 domain-containing protein [Bifidobacterium animalis]MCR1996017.1 DUF4012 domain-containing protein [Bifidobacterium animalis subsp. animalis]
MAQHRYTTHRSHRQRRIWPWIVGILAIFTVLMIVVSVAGTRLYRQAQEVKTHENRAISLLNGLSGDINDESIAKIQQSMPEIQRETQAANAIVHGSLWNVAAKAPLVGSDIQTVQGMTEIVNEIMNKSVPAFIEVVNTLQKDNLANGNGINLQPIQDAQAKLSAANEKLQKQVHSYNSISAPKISQIKNAYDQGQNQLNGIANKVNKLTNTFDILPQFLGAGQTRTYAVMAMTTSEMRSSGGLIGSVGEITTDNGVIRVGDFKPNTDYLPYESGDRSSDMNRIFTDEGPLHMSFDIRDLAVFPDTEQTAISMRSIWQRTPWGANRALDGVVTVDPVFVQELVKICGNVTLPNGAVLTGENTAEYLLNTVYKEYGDNNTATDAVFAAAASQVLSNMFKDTNVRKLMRIGEMMGTMAAERHFSVFVFDKNLENTIQQAGFTASTPKSEENPSVGIYLTEQNPSKMGWYIKRTARITTVSCDSSKGDIYHVEYTLDNTLQESEVAQLPRYITSAGTDYGIGVEKILFYPPKGGRISNIALINGAVNSVQEDTLDGKKIYRTLARVNPGQKLTYSFDVNVSSKSKSPLAIDQTPMGWTGTGVTYSGERCTAEN